MPKWLPCSDQISSALDVVKGITAQIARVDNERNRYGQLARLLGELPQRLGVADVGVGDLDEAEVVRLRMSHETEVLGLAAVSPAPKRRRWGDDRAAR